MKKAKRFARSFYMLPYQARQFSWQQSSQCFIFISSNMRNITIHPITVAEVCDVVKRTSAKLDDDTSIGSVDGLALGYLMNFLEQKWTQKNLLVFLETAQPKLKVEGLDTLDKETVQRLWAGAYGLCSRDKNPIVHTMEYRGISDRGSHVYDCSKRSVCSRVYVRIMDSKLRGEINEDNFSIKEPCPPLVSQIGAHDVDMEAPASGIGRWWQTWRNKEWR